MGRGRSPVGKSGAKPTQTQKIQDFPEAFAPGKDFQAVGGVNHKARTVSRMTQAEWDQYSAPLNSGTTAKQEKEIMRQYDPNPNHQGAYVSGYVRTQNSFAINEILYKPGNDTKTPAQMFSRKEDVNTVNTMDKLIAGHTTQSDASYTRFCSESALQATFGFSDAQMALIKKAPTMNAAQLSQLNNALAGSTSYSAAFTSTSANRSLNAFSNPSAPQSKGFIFERRLNVRAGTNAYAPKQNAQESEVIFGRHANTSFGGISISGDGHIVFHENFNGYGKKGGTP